MCEFMFVLTHMGHANAEGCTLDSQVMGLWLPWLVCNCIMPVGVSVSVDAHLFPGCATASYSHE